MLKKLLTAVLLLSLTAFAPPDYGCGIGNPGPPDCQMLGHSCWEQDDCCRRYVCREVEPPRRACVDPNACRDCPTCVGCP